MQQSFIVFCSILFLLIIFFIYTYRLGEENKQNEILANRKKNKYKRIDDIEEVKERIKEGKL